MKHLWQTNERQKVESKYKDNAIFKVIRLATTCVDRSSGYSFTVPELFFQVMYCIDTISCISSKKERCDECGRMWSDIFDDIQNKAEVDNDNAADMASQVLMLTVGLLFSMDHLLFFDEGRAILSSIKGNSPENIRKYLKDIEYVSKSNNIVQILSDYYFSDACISDEIYDLLHENGNQEEVLDYPPITEAHKKFFKEKLRVTGDNGLPKKIDMPVEKILHVVFRMTREWENDRTFVHKWKVLYVLLANMNYIEKNVRERYSDYVKVVVGYCFPEEQKNISNNMSKVKLDKDISSWKDCDIGLYKSLKQQLTFV